MRNAISFVHIITEFYRTGQGFNFASIEDFAKAFRYVDMATLEQTKESFFVGSTKDLEKRRRLPSLRKSLALLRPTTRQIDP